MRRSSRSFSSEQVLVAGVLLVFSIGVAVIVVGNERPTNSSGQDEAKVEKKVDRDAEIAIETQIQRPAAEPSTNKLAQASDTDDSSTSNSNAWIAELSSDELIKLASGELAPEELVDAPQLSNQEIETLLLRELARRFEKRSVTQAASSTEQKESPEEPTDGQVAHAETIEATTKADKSDSLDHDASEPTSSVAPPIEIVIEKSLTEVTTGKLFSVGRIEINFLENAGPVIYPDQPLYLESTDNRAHYATFDMEYDHNAKYSPYLVKKIQSLFLIRDQEPVTLHLRGPSGELFSETVDHFSDSISSYRNLHSMWWSQFKTIDPNLGEAHRNLKESLLEILSRRAGLGWTRPAQPRKQANELEGLEAQFERAIGMLLGIESVKLAMQDDVTLHESYGNAKATLPLPKPPRLRSLVTPDYRPVPIESIAMHVPNECFYLRTRNAANYFEFRDFLTGWGGNLNDIVSSGALDHDARRKLEIQLAFPSDHLDIAQLDRSISDMALIGCDPLFQQGAAVGVLFEARNGRTLETEIHKQRQRIQTLFPGTKEQAVQVGPLRASFLSTQDNQVRSFYAVDGDFHLVTNSEYVLNRFVEAGQGINCLGKLREFGYARSKTVSADAMAFLYLSDPFFQHLVSPQYRIEMTRRAIAAAELQTLQLARLVAWSERRPASSIRDLIDLQLLPEHFADRQDATQPVFREGYYQDSLRGVRGSFIPVPDVTIDKITSSESRAYQHFLNQYNQQWGRIDPVTLVLTKSGSLEAGNLQHYDLDIVVTPYARARYARLDRHLSATSDIQLSSANDDLLSVRTAVRAGIGMPSHLLGIGVRDASVPFEIENGEIRLLPPFAGSTFAKGQSYAVINPPSTDVLRSLASVLLGKSIPASVTKPAKARPLPSSILPAFPFPNSLGPATQPLTLLAWSLSNMSPQAIGAAKYTSLVESRGDLMVIAMNQTLREQVFGGTSEVQTNRSHKVWMNMRSLEGAKVEPYIQAFTFMQSRRESTEYSRMMNDLTQWLHLPPEHARNAIEDLLQAKLRCPLGGDFENVGEHQRVLWRSSAWSNDSVYRVKTVPKDWKFGFLDWLQGLELTFDLGQDTLQANVKLTVHKQSGGPQVPAPDDLPEVFPVDRRHPDSAAKTDSPTKHDDQIEFLPGVRVLSRDNQITVAHVEISSAAYQLGIRVGDVIEKVNNQTLGPNHNLAEVLSAEGDADGSQLLLRRDGAKLRVLVAAKQ